MAELLVDELSKAENGRIMADIHLLCPLDGVMHTGTVQSRNCYGKSFLSPFASSYDCEDLV